MTAKTTKPRGRRDAKTPEGKATRIRQLGDKIEKAGQTIEEAGAERDALISALHVDDGLSYRAIAAMIGRSYVTVNKAHARHVERAS